VLYAGVQNIWSPHLYDSAIFRDSAAFNALPASVKAASGQGPNWTAAKYDLTAMGEALQSINQVLRGMTSSRPLIFDKRVMVHPHIQYKINPYPGLWGFKFSNTTRQSVLLVNNTAQPYTVSTVNVAPTGVRYRSKAGDPVHSYKTYVKNASSLKKTTGLEPNTKRLRLPPYSITTLGPF
jgi:hypothetical protein